MKWAVTMILLLILSVSRLSIISIDDLDVLFSACLIMNRKMKLYWRGYCMFSAVARGFISILVYVLEDVQGRREFSWKCNVIVFGGYCPLIKHVLRAYLTTFRRGKRESYMWRTRPPMNLALKCPRDQLSSNCCFNSNEKGAKYPVEKDSILVTQG